MRACVFFSIDRKYPFWTNFCQLIPQDLAPDLHSLTIPDRNLQIMVSKTDIATCFEYEAQPDSYYEPTKADTRQSQRVIENGVLKTVNQKYEEKYQHSSTCLIKYVSM